MVFLIGTLSTWAGLDRDRALHPAIMMAIASYYVLFAVMGSSGQTIVVESIVAMLVRNRGTNEVSILHM
jgi:hypothetical protein